jgi:hypothetical protein
MHFRKNGYHGVCHYLQWLKNVPPAIPYIWYALISIGLREFLRLCKVVILLQITLIYL